MNLEAIEQRTLKFLLESRNPLVPLESLMRHLSHHEDCAGASRADVLSFLRKHELFRVMEPPGLAEGGEAAKALAAAGLPVGPQVVLDTRIPDPFELARLMSIQMKTLTDAITSAMNAAREKGQADRVRALMMLHEKAGQIAAQLENHL